MTNNLLNLLQKESIISNNLNLDVLLAENGKSEVKMLIDEKVLNPYGIVHGGATFTLADTTAGAAAISLGSEYVTMDANIHYLNPGTGQYLLAKGDIIYIGEHTCVVEIIINKDEGILVAKGTFTMFKIEIEFYYYCPILIYS